MTRRLNLLSVDWDFFFPEPTSGPEVQLYDWGHSEHGIIAVMSQTLWMARAAGFVRHHYPLPRPLPTEGFWERFTFAEDAAWFIADSHAYAYAPQVRHALDGLVHTIWSYDAHHDCGYGPSPRRRFKQSRTVSCENWLLAYDTPLVHARHIRYPTWKQTAFSEERRVPRSLFTEFTRTFDDAQNPPPVEPFDVVFLCRSGSWVPPWCDGEFVRFVHHAAEAAPRPGTPNRWQVLGNTDPRLLRPFKIETVHRFIRELEAHNAATTAPFPVILS